MARKRVIEMHGEGNVKQMNYRLAEGDTVEELFFVSELLNRDSIPHAIVEEEGKTVVYREYRRDVC